MSPQKKRKGAVDYDKERYDRVTITLHKGSKKFFKRLGLEIDSDMSKITRIALEEFVQRHMHRLSDDLKKQHDELRKFGDWDL